MIKIINILFFLLVAASGCLCAQTPDWNQVKAMEEETLDSIYNLSSVSTQWLEGSSCLAYSQYRKYYLVNAATGKQTPLFTDSEAFVLQARQLTGDTTLRAGSLSLYGLGLRNGNSNLILWSYRGKHYVYNRTTGKLTADSDWKPEKRKSFHWNEAHAYTTDSLYTMLGDAHNLYVRDNRTGIVKQLTTDGCDYGSYCFRSAKDSIREGSAAGRWYGHVYLDFVQDDSKVGELYIIDGLSGDRPILRTKKMPLPNENNVRQFKLFWYNADSGEGKLLPISPFKDPDIKLNYADTGDWLFFTRRSRGVDTLDLCKLHIPTGRISLVIREVSKPHLNVSLFNYHLLNQGKEILWWSEHTGRGNWYLYDGNGKLKRRLTEGDNLVADRIERIDTVGRSFIFLGHGLEKCADPAYTYYYKVRLDGGHQQLLTPGNGTHELSFSPDGNYAIDSYSRMDLPTVYQTVNIRRPGKAQVEAAAKLPLKRGQICIYWGVWELRNRSDQN